MSKTAFSIALFGTIVALSGCLPTATIVGESYTPINYTYAPGYSPPQAAYPDVPTDANTTIDTAATIEEENAINAQNDALAAAEKEKEAAQQQAIEQQLNSIPGEPGFIGISY